MPAPSERSVAMRNELPCEAGLHAFGRCLAPNSTCLRLHLPECVDKLESRVRFVPRAFHLFVEHLVLHRVLHRGRSLQIDGWQPERRERRLWGVVSSA